MIADSFPSEFVDPEDKLLDAYAVQYASAMLGNYINHADKVFYNNATTYDHLLRLAQGKQDVTDIKQLMGHFVDSENVELQESLAYIDIRVLKLIPKYVNTVVGRLNQLRYDITLTPLDQSSVSEQQQYEGLTRAFLDMQDFMNQIGVKAEEIFAELDVEKTLAAQEDMEMEIEMNPLQYKAMKGEIAIKIGLMMNNWDQVKREVAYDLTVRNAGFVRVYRDKNGIPRLKRIHPKDFISATPQGESLENLDYAGHIEYITANQYRREASPFRSQAQIEEDILHHAVENRRFDLNYGVNGRQYDGLNYMPILRYQFLSENTEKYVVRKDIHGNRKVDQKKYDFRPRFNERDLYDSGVKELIVNTYTTKYEGNFVVGSEIVYDHHVSSVSAKNEMNLVDEKLDYIGFIPNLQDGTAVGLLEMMVEPMLMANLAWNRIKEILADGWMGIREVDFSELEAVAMGKGGTSWTPRQVYEFFQQKRTLIKRGKTNKYDQRNGSAIEEKNMGLTLTDYMNSFQMAVNQLGEITGLGDMATTTSPGERTLVGVMQMATENSNMAMDWLFHAFQSIYHRTSECLLYSMQAAVREGKKIGYALPAQVLGNRTTKYFEADPVIGNRAYAIYIERQPDQVLWERLYAMVDKAVNLGPLQGGISMADAVYIMFIDNFKQAMSMLAHREEKRRKQNQQQLADQNKMLQETNAQSADAAAKNADALEKKKHDMLLERDNNAHLNKMKELKFEAEYTDRQTGLANQGKRAVAQQQGGDRIIQESIRAKVEQQKLATLGNNDN